MAAPGRFGETGVGTKERPRALAAASPQRRITGTFPALQPAGVLNDPDVHRRRDGKWLDRDAVAVECLSTGNTSLDAHGAVRILVGVGGPLTAVAGLDIDIPRIGDVLIDRTGVLGPVVVALASGRRATTVADGSGDA